MRIQKHILKRLQAKALHNPAVIIRAGHDNLKFMVVFKYQGYDDTLTGYLSFDEASEFCNIINQTELE